MHSRLSDHLNSKVAFGKMDVGGRLAKCLYMLVTLDSIPAVRNTAVKRNAHVRDLRKAREKLRQIVYKGVRTEQKHKK